MVMKFTNNATSTLASAITNVATSLTVSSGGGALFPTLGAGDYFYCTLANSSGTIEIVKVTARSTDVFTITRAQDNTTGSAFSIGDKVELRLVAASLNDLPKLDEANTFTENSIFSSTGSLLISKGTTGQRPTPVNGMIRFNTTTSEFEGYTGAAWASVGGSAISNDTSTATNLYPLFAAATSGTALTVYTGNAKLLYKPSTGEFTSSVLTASNGIVVNSLTVATNYTIAAGYSGSSAGPVTVSSGIVVTVSSGSRWVVI